MDIPVVMFNEFMMEHDTVTHYIPFPIQVVNLHYMLSKAVVKARPSVLWCYKKDLHLSRCDESSSYAVSLLLRSKLMIIIKTQSDIDCQDPNT